MNLVNELTGAFWDESGISESLRADLARMDMIEDALERSEAEGVRGTRMKPITFACKETLALTPEEIAHQILDLTKWPDFRGYGPIGGYSGIRHCEGDWLIFRSNSGSTEKSA